MPFTQIISVICQKKKSSELTTVRKTLHLWPLFHSPCLSPYFPLAFSEQALPKEILMKVTVSGWAVP